MYQEIQNFMWLCFIAIFTLLRLSGTKPSLHLKYACNYFFSLYSSFWRRKWQPTPVFLPGESHGQRGLVGCGLWGCKELDMTKQLTHAISALENVIRMMYFWVAGELIILDVFIQFSSVQFRRSVASDCLQPHESQYTRPPCPSPTPGVHSNSRPSSQWYHPAISSSVIPFSSCPQSLPASESFPMSQLFASGGQSTGVSALASVLPKNTQDWSPLEWTGWIPCSPRDSQESSPTPQFKSINS